MGPFRDIKDPFGGVKGPFEKWRGPPSRTPYKKKTVYAPAVKPVTMNVKPLGTPLFGDNFWMRWVALSNFRNERFRTSGNFYYLGFSTPNKN